MLQRRAADQRVEESGGPVMRPRVHGSIQDAEGVPCTGCFQRSPVRDVRVAQLCAGDLHEPWKIY
ncbi:hypothetical protein GCM10010260_58560 [Streptomyces filipinensis]|uniref:Uncharacterized protein n=1 Tax=Streptomyces filipinensis TaxID=66887 RepID=A0A918IFR4_9ACTN|nr:hypothetical protein GCM10010260_58560 [Streptomyces filipinensis]